MLRAGQVGLRARDEADIAVLHAELYEDIATYTIADSRPWRPIPADSSASPYAIGEPRDDPAPSASSPSYHSHTRRSHCA